MPHSTCLINVTYHLSALSREDVTPAGERRTEPILGSDPVAYLMYDASGHFAVQLMRRDRTPFRANAEGPLVGDQANWGEMTGYDAYFGRYTVGADSTVTQELVGRPVSSRCRQGSDPPISHHRRTHHHSRR